MKEILRPLRAEISLKNVRHNYRVLRAMVSREDFFCPMIKANAYGHGDVEVARELINEGAEHFGVALVEEAVRLRESGIMVDLLVFGPFVDRASADAVVRHELTPVVSSWEALRALEAAVQEQTARGALGASVNVHLKFNTGMNRLGFAPGEVNKLRDYFSQTQISSPGAGARVLNPKLVLKGVCTHLLSGDDALQKNGRTAKQLQIFSKIFESFKSDEVKAHVLNSSALLARFLESNDIRQNVTHSTLTHWGARPGISLYGIVAPVNGLSDNLKSVYEAIDLRPVMRVVSEIVHIQNLAKGETVSYGGRYQVNRDSTIGVVPIGYADGYMRRLSTKSKMVFRGQCVPVAGTVCMDFSMVDLTDVAPLVGDEIVVLGRQESGVHAAQVTALELAEAAGTIPYEVLTNFSARVPRVYV